MAEERLKLNTKTRQRFARIRRLSQMKGLDPIAFEHFVGYLYQRQGYWVYTTVTSGDEGVDLILRKWRRTIVVQCKRYSGTVGQPVVRDLYGAMLHNNAQEAILATSGNISRPAELWAADKPIRLVDGHELLSMTRQVRMGSGRNLLAALGRVVALLLLLGAVLAVGFWWRNGRLQPGPTPIAIGTATATAAATPTIAPTAVDQDATATPEPAASPTPLPASPTPADLPEDGGAGTAVRLAQPPRIDGQVSDWDGAGWQPVAYSLGLAATEATAGWQAGWDETHLYLAVQVRARQAFNGDDRLARGHINIELDMVRTADWGSPVSADDFWYRLLVVPGQALVPQLAPGDGSGWSSFAPSESRAAVVVDEAGYVAEIALSWAEMGGRPADPAGFALTLELADGGTVLLSTAPGRENGRPETWGVLTLIEN